MVKKEQLHTLIHALSKSEKRYFKLFCAREMSGKNYLQLFDAIDQQEVYDEQLIKQRFSDRKFTAQLHVTKNYLRKLIYKSLRNFHEKSSKEAEVKDILRNIEILYQKELYKHCEEELKRALNLASFYELTTAEVEVHKWRLRLELAKNPYHYSYFREVLNEQLTAIKKLKNLNDYWLFGIAATPGNIGQSTQSANHIKDPDKAITLEAKVLHYNAAYMHYLLTEKRTEAEKELLTLLQLLEDHPERIREEPGNYVTSINNLVSFYVFNQQFQDALLLIQKAKKFYAAIQVNTEQHKLLKQMLRTYNIELEIYRLTKWHDSKTNFITQTEQFIEKNVNKMPKEYLLSFWFQLASIYFMQGDLSKSLKWVNKVINSRFGKVRTDLQVQAHLLNLMVHFDQDNLMVLRYFVGSAKRYMKKVDEIEPYEIVLLRFFIKIGRLPLLEYNDAFFDLKRRLFPENEPPLIPTDMLDYIDYKEWIDSKLKHY